MPKEKKPEDDLGKEIEFLHLEGEAIDAVVKEIRLRLKKGVHDPKVRKEMERVERKYSAMKASLKRRKEKTRKKMH